MALDVILEAEDKLLQKQSDSKTISQIGLFPACDTKEPSTEMQQQVDKRRSLSKK